MPKWRMLRVFEPEMSAVVRMAISHSSDADPSSHDRSYALIAIRKYPKAECSLD
jgi:hypothetical protein